jgi:hypothetical protein
MWRAASRYLASSNLSPLRRSVKGAAVPVVVAFVAPFSSSSLREWEKLTERERQAWRVLGWTKRSWSGTDPAPASDTALWKELSPEEQAALQYGLSYTAQSWDAELLDGSDDDDDDGAEPEDESAINTVPRDGGGASGVVAEAGGVPGTRSRGIVSSLFGVFSGAARAADTATAVASSGDVFTAWQELNVTPVELSSGYESIIYLDDSGSMLHGGVMQAGQDAFQDAVDILQRKNPTEFAERSRILLFGTNKTELKGRGDPLDAKVVRGLWRGDSGMTYLWHMIYEDIQRRYRPGGPGTLRVVVVTDGEDTQSPGRFNGMTGMDPLMEQLLALNFKIEWNIIVLGLDSSSSEARRYSDLCGATGGSFLSLPGPYRSGDPGPKRFMGNLRRAVEDGEKVAAEQRRAFEAKKGATKFGWYAQLPPPPKK